MLWQDITSFFNIETFNVLYFVPGTEISLISACKTAVRPLNRKWVLNPIAVRPTVYIATLYYLPFSLKSNSDFITRVTSVAMWLAPQFRALKIKVWLNPILSLMSYKVIVLKIVIRKKNSLLFLVIFYIVLYFPSHIFLFPKYKYMHMYVILKSRR